MIQNEITFRKYESADLTRCAELAEQAWPVRERAGPAPGQSSVMEPWIESSAYSSTWAEVAIASGEVVGFLFASIEKQKPREPLVEALFGPFWMFRQFLSSGANRFRIPFSVAVGFFFMEFKLTVNRPKADAEIILLIVDARFRGKGIGKALVDRFVEAAKKVGSSSIVLYTDDRSSNWKFYEIYGFEKVTTFYDNISSYFAGQHANAIYYLLNLERK